MVARFGNGNRDNENQQKKWHTKKLNVTTEWTAINFKCGKLQMTLINWIEIARQGITLKYCRDRDGTKIELFIPSIGTEIVVASNNLEFFRISKMFDEKNFVNLVIEKFLFSRFNVINKSKNM